jgi:hypothetical protein
LAFDSLEKRPHFARHRIAAAVVLASLGGVAESYVKPATNVIGTTPVIIAQRAPGILASNLTH